MARPAGHLRYHTGMKPIDQALNSLLDEAPEPRRQLPVSTKPPAPGMLGVRAAMALDAAAGADSETLAEKYGMTAAEEHLAAQPYFAKVVEALRADVETHGVSFRLKAAMQAEALLESRLWEMAQDPTTPAQVLLDYFKALTKVGGLEPKPQAAQEGSGFQLVINLGSDQTVLRGGPRTIDVEEA